MDWVAMAWAAIIPAVVILSLTFLPNASSLAIVILLGMIKKKIKTTADRSIPITAPGGPRAPPVVASPPRGPPPPDPPPPGPPSPSGASPPAGPPSPGGASPPAVDALVPSGKERSKPESSSTSSSSSGFKYGVYLNFRGSDACATFVADLDRALVDAGISVFKGDEAFYVGGPQIVEAIHGSRILIAVFSKNYASSRRCLWELAHMWWSRESKEQIIIPIFYDVSPSDVRYQAGDFGRSFVLHEMGGFGLEINYEWRMVLHRIGKLRGYVRENINEGHEGELIKEVVARVVQVLKMDDQVVTDKLVGIDHHVQEMMRKLGVAYSEGQATDVPGEEVHVVGICGEPGVGKTTLAKVVFNKMHKLFDACSFLEDIRLEGVQFSRRRLIADLQKQKPKPLESSGEEIANLCRNTKVLIVLDDVDEDGQIKKLAGNLTWFGPGSRIIVTTNKREVLKAFDVGAVEEHTVKPMDHGDAHKLFCKHVFRGAAAEDISQYSGLSEDIAKAIGGLPSDIVRHALSLRGNMNMDTWKTTFDLLQEKSKK